MGYAATTNDLTQMRMYGRHHRSIGLAGGGLGLGGGLLGAMMAAALMGGSLHVPDLPANYPHRTPEPDRTTEQDNAAMAAAEERRARRAAKRAENQRRIEAGKERARLKACPAA